MKQLFTAIIFFLLATISISAQETISAKLLDSTFKEPVPFATITLNNSYGVVSNSTGNFTLNLSTQLKKTDSIFISCMGFESKQISLQTFKDSTIILNPKIFELNEVSVTSKKYTVKEIIEKVKENLDANYEFGFLKSTFFYRESGFTNVSTKNIKVKKSTIPEFNQQFFDSIMNSMPAYADNYTEILGVKYGNYKPESSHKMEILKASELYDKNNEITFNSFQDRINNVIKKRVKPDSYFKIKSGLLFGTKEEMDSTMFSTPLDKESTEFIKEQKAKEDERKANFLSSRLNAITALEKTSLIFEDTPFNFLDKSSRYEFELVDYVFLNEKYVYKISFKPKRSEDYEGTFYVNLDNFAIERFDFKNTKRLKSFSLLGISYQYNVHKGTFIYIKNGNNKYALKLAETVDVNKFGIDRPLKIIEKNKNVKGKRKQNEISGNINFEIIQRDKKELVIFENSIINKTEFENFEQKPNVKPTYLPAYDPNFWSGYDVLEPNEAIKTFKSID